MSKFASFPTLVLQKPTSVFSPRSAFMQRSSEVPPSLSRAGSISSRRLERAELRGATGTRIRADALVDTLSASIDAFADAAALKQLGAQLHSLAEKAMARAAALEAAAHEASQALLPASPPAAASHALGRSLLPTLPPQQLFVALLEALLSETGPPAALPVVSHADRLPSGRRGLSLAALRAIRAFYAERGGLDKVMADVCKEARFEASVCAVTASTGLSLAESVVHVAGTSADVPIDVSALVGAATSFFSYSWTGTTLGDMLAAIMRKLEALEAADGVRRFVWIDMFAASQNLLAGRYLPETEAARTELKARDLTAYRARKEDTDTIFESAIDAVGASVPREILLYLSPLTGEWRAPEQPFLLPDRGTPPTDWVRKGPGAISRAWCCFEMVKTLAKGCRLHVVLSPADSDGFEVLLTRRFDEIAGIVAGIDVRDAQISKVEDRDYILREVAELEGGLGSVTARVCEALREWLAAEGKAALGRVVDASERGASVLLRQVASLLRAQGKLEEAAPLYREALEARRATLGDRHPSTLVSINNMASLLQDQGELDAAELLLRESLDVCCATLVPGHRTRLRAHGWLADVLRAKGHLSRAREALGASELDAAHTALGPTVDTTLMLEAIDARLQCAEDGSHNLQPLRTVLARTLASLGPSSPTTHRCERALAEEIARVASPPPAF